jgi:MFS family permease
MVGIAVIAPAGIGMLIGSLILDRRKDFDLMRAINKAFFLVGVALLLFSLYRLYGEFILSRLISTLLVVAVGVGSSIIYISAQTALQVSSEEKWRGRVFGINSMFVNVAMSAPSLFVGGIADLTSPFIAMLLIAFGVFVYGASLFIETTTTSSGKF